MNARNALSPSAPARTPGGKPAPVMTSGSKPSSYIWFVMVSEPGGWPVATIILRLSGNARMFDLKSLAPTGATSIWMSNGNSDSMLSWIERPQP